MNKITNTAAIIVCIGFLIVLSTQASDESIKYPSNYRDWTHIKSMVIQEGHPLHTSFGGIHHIYANNQALIGYQSGTFPDGSVIVFDLLESNETNNAIIESHRKVLGVMEKDIQKYPYTAGWGFEGFEAGEPNNRIVGVNYKEACFTCHISQKENDYVFSKWRD